MNREELLTLHKRNSDRPQFYRAHRDAFAEHLSDTTAGKLPNPDASTFEWRQFLESHKGVITRQLDDDTPGSDPHNEETDGETPTTDGDESEV